MKKILHVFASLNMGGAESRMMDVYRNIDREKYTFDFLCMQQGDQYYEPEIRSTGGRIIKIDPPRISGVYANFRAIRRVLRDGCYDAVHAHTSFHCGVVMLAAWSEKVPIRISHARTSGSLSDSPASKIAFCIGKLLIALFATCRLAISREAGIYLFGHKSFTIMHNAIDCEKYYSGGEGSLREELSIPDGATIFGLVGRFDKMKNHAFSLRWFAQYSKKETDRLIFVGDGELRNDMENLSAALNIRDKVIFTGIRSDIPAFMHLFDVLIVPSLYEGLGGVILEAQAAGIPVVKADTFTNEADMQLGLVRQAGLSNYESFNNAADMALRSERPDVAQRDEQFKRRGYSLAAEIQTLCHIYGEDV